MRSKSAALQSGIRQAKIKTAVAGKHCPLQKVQIAARFSILNGNCQGPLTFFCCRGERCGIRNQIAGSWSYILPEMACICGTATRHETAVMRARLMRLCSAVRSSVSVVIFRITGESMFITITYSNAKPTRYQYCPGPSAFRLFAASAAAGMTVSVGKSEYSR